MIIKKFQLSIEISITGLEEVQMTTKTSLKNIPRYFSFHHPQNGLISWLACLNFYHIACRLRQIDTMILIIVIKTTLKGVSHVHTLYCTCCMNHTCCNFQPMTSVFVTLSYRSLCRCLIKKPMRSNKKTLTDLPTPGKEETGFKNFRALGSSIFFLSCKTNFVRYLVFFVFRFLIMTKWSWDSQ